MNLKTPLSLALVVLFGLSGCQRSAEPDAAPAADSAPADAAVAPAPTAAAGDSKSGAYDAFVPSGPALDQRAFAGRFTATLPCASCPGIDTALELKDDYSFILDETYKEKKGGGPFKIKGTWSAENDGHLLRLDPDSKAEADRLYQVIANDEIRMLDPEGKPIEGTLDYSLRREGSGG